MLTLKIHSKRRNDIIIKIMELQISKDQRSTWIINWIWKETMDLDQPW